MELMKHVEGLESSAQAGGLDIANRRRIEIEMRLEACRDGIASGFIEMGRWLNRAKEEAVVPHGEWTAWVEGHAGVNERTAQRIMRAARELPEGSPLERLGIAKVDALLRLPEADRERAASLMDAENLSAREVSRRVDQLQGKTAEPLANGNSPQCGEIVPGSAGDRGPKPSTCNGDEDQRRRIARLEATNQLQVEKLSELRAKLAKEQESAQAANDMARRAEAHVAELMEENGRLRNRPRAPERSAEEEALRAKLAAAEAESDRLAEELDRMKLASAKAEIDGGMDATRILSDIGGFCAIVGQIPARIREGKLVIRRSEANLVAGRVAVVAAWCDAMYSVLGNSPRKGGAEDGQK